MQVWDMKNGGFKSVAFPHKHREREEGVELDQARTRGQGGGDSGVTVGAHLDFLRESPLWLRMAVSVAERIRSHAPCFRRNLPRVQRVPRRRDIM